jgi:Holliday junction resolvase
MPRSIQARNAARGIAVERRAQGELEAAGYAVMRAAGSHGPFDLVASRRDACRHIQIKSVKRPRRFPRVIEELTATPKPATCVAELWVWLTGQGWVEKTVIPAEEDAAA